MLHDPLIVLCFLCLVSGVSGAAMLYFKTTWDARSVINEKRKEYQDKIRGELTFRCAINSDEIGRVQELIAEYRSI